MELLKQHRAEDNVRMPRNQDDSTITNAWCLRITAVD